MKRCTVTISQSASTALSRRVYDFEVPVLGVIHGHGNVSVTNEEAAKAIPAEEAMSILIRRYRDDGVIRAVYRDTRDLADKTGLKVTGDVPVERKSVQLVSNKPEAAAAGSKAA